MMINPRTPQWLALLPGGWPGLLTMLTLPLATLLVSGCGDSSEPAREQATDLAEQGSPPAKLDTTGATKHASAKKNRRRVNRSHSNVEPRQPKAEENAAAENELRLPGVVANAPLGGETDGAMLRLTAPNAVDHPPLKRQAAESQEPTNLGARTAGNKPHQETIDLADTTLPATVRDAKRVIDLRKLPTPSGASAVRATPTQSSLTAASSVADLKAFYESQLAAAGWRSLTWKTTAPMTAEYGQVEFTKEGFQLGVTLSRAAGTNQTHVSIHNYGNLDAQRLPSPAESQRLFGNPISVLYVTAADVSTVAETCLERLAAAGWQAYSPPYTMATENKSQRSLLLKQNGVGLTALVAVAPARRNQTTVRYTLRMLGDELPAPRDALGIEFLESPLQLSCDTRQGIAETLKFYRQTLAQQGWEESGTANQQPSEAVAVFERKAGPPIVVRLNRTHDGQFTQVAIAEFEMPRDAPATVFHQTPEINSVAETPGFETPVNATSNTEASRDTTPRSEVPAPRQPELQPELQPALPGVLPGMMTFEAWLARHHYQASPARLNQFAREMEAIANRSADGFSAEKPPKRGADAKTGADLSSAFGNQAQTNQAQTAQAQTDRSGRITALDLHGRKLDDTRLQRLAAGRELVELNLSATSITDQGLKALLGLTKLKTLNLAETALTDASIPQLVQLRSLRELDLRGTKISLAGLKTLAAALPECAIQR